MKINHAAAWGAGVVLVLALLIAGLCYLVTDHGDPNARTVASVWRDGDNQVASPPERDQSSSGINELLSELGLPVNSIGQVGMAQKNVSGDKRARLESTLNIAVQAGSLSEEDAKSVLKAFDSGIVDAAAGPLVLENNSRTVP